VGCFLCFELNHIKCWSLWFNLANLVGYSNVCEACSKSYCFDPFSPIFQNTWEMHLCPIRGISLSFLKLNYDPKNLVSSKYVSCACYVVSQKIQKSLKKFAKSSQFKSSSIVVVQVVHINLKVQWVPKYVEIDVFEFYLHYVLVVRIHDWISNNSIDIC